MHATRLLATGLLVLSLSGCGFLVTNGPPAGHEQMRVFSCTDDNAGPVLDVLWALLNLLNAALIASDRDTYNNPDAAVAGSLGWAVVSSISAAQGFKKTAACRRALQRLAERSAPRVDTLAATVAAVVVTPPEDTLRVGEGVQLVATAHSSSGAAVPNRPFTWSSSNDAIASVSAAGLVTAHAAGSIVIAATTGNVTGTARILVRPRE